METVYVFTWETTSQGASGFEWAEAPALLLTKIANRVNPPDNDLHKDPDVFITWVGPVQVDKTLDESVTDQVESHLMNEVWR